MPDRPMSGEGGNCPDLETLAAYADGTLDVRAREEVEAHLAECEECYELVAEVARSQEMDAAELSVPTPVVPGEPEKVVRVDVLRPAFGRRRVWMVAGGILAVAAALVLVARVQPVWWQRITGSRQIDSQMAKLVEAVGDQRTVEGRLTGGFRYGTYRSPVRGGALPTNNLGLLAAAGELQRSVQEDPNAANLHAYGVAQVLLGQYDQAILHLEMAAAEAPDDGRLLTDLAAAYIARAKGIDRPDDWPKAVEAAETALDIDARLPEAIFNKALALEGLLLTDQAIDTWDEYVRVDPNSGWAAEARQRAEVLRRLKRSDSGWSETLEELTAALERKDSARGLAIAATARRRAFVNGCSKSDWQIGVRLWSPAMRSWLMPARALEAAWRLAAVGGRRRGRIENGPADREGGGKRSAPGSQRRCQLWHRFWSVSIGGHRGVGLRPPMQVSAEAERAGDFIETGAVRRRQITAAHEREVRLPRLPSGDHL